MENIIDLSIQNRLLVIVGATAVGKTDLSLRVAARYGGEVISADSRLFYRHMDIGTAKPSLEERATIPHHFIDIVNPNETVTLGWYQDECYRLINSLHHQGKLPILVGGTGQYVKAIVEGWGIPRVAPQPDLRAELEQKDSHALYSRLRDLDPIAAQKIHPNNKRRLIRALEVCIIAGEPISKLQAKNPPPYNTLMLGLKRERKALYRRIDDRVDQMMAAGLLDEMQHLREMGYGRELPAMSGIGYQQLWEFFEGQWTLPEAIERIKMETHRFVRHQNNWFGKDENIVWIDANADDFPESALTLVSHWLTLK